MENRDKTVQSDLLKQNSENLPTGGPRFGLEDKGGWGKKIRGWINKYGSSVVFISILAKRISQNQFCLLKKK